MLPNTPTTDVFIATGDQLYSQDQYTRSLKQAWAEYINGGPSNVSEESLTELYTMSATAFATANFRADVTSAIPLRVATPQDSELPSEFHPLTFFLQNSQTVLWHTYMGLLVWGQAYLLKKKNARGYPTGLQWLNPERVKNEYNYKTGELIGFRFDDVFYKRSDVVYIPAWDPSNTRDGKSRFELVISQITTEVNMANHAASFFFNKARPDGILIYKGGKTLTDEQKEVVKADWKKFKGSDNAFKTFISSGEWEWQAITVPMADLAMTELKQEIRQDISIAMQVDMALIGAEDLSGSLSGNSILSTKKRAHIENVALPWMAYVLGELNRQWAWTDFKRKGLYTLYPDKSKVPALSDFTTEKITDANSSLGSGLTTFRESRGVLGLAPYDFFLDMDPTLVNAAWTGTQITLNEMRRIQNLEGFDENGEVVLINGTLVPVARILEYAEKSLASSPSPFGFGAPAPDEEDEEDPEPEANPFEEDETVEEEEVEPEDVEVDDDEDVRGHARSDERNLVGFTLRATFASVQTLMHLRRLVNRRTIELDRYDIMWTNPESWSFALARNDNATAVQVSDMIQAVSFQQGTRFFIWPNRVSWYAGELRVYFEPTPEYEVLIQAVKVQLSGVRGTTFLEEPYVVLGYVDEPIEDLHDQLTHHVSINRIAVQTADSELFNWMLSKPAHALISEISSWRSKALKFERNLKFSFEYAPARVVKMLSLGLRMGMDPKLLADEAYSMVREIEVVNEEDAETPDEYLTYWGNFDKLVEETGTEWLSYARNVKEALIDYLDEDTATRGGVETFFHENDAMRRDLALEWTGTADEFGPLTKFVLAGMAAGNESALYGADSDYRSNLRKIAIVTDWDLLSVQALEFTREYAYSLIRNLDQKTIADLIKILEEWIIDGETIPELRSRVENLIDDPVRADLIATTEASRAYNRGAYARWEDVGVEQATWYTVRDSRVCPICAPLDGQIGYFRSGWIHPGGVHEVEGEKPVDATKHKDKIFQHPAHPRCRCFGRPVVT